MDSHLRDTLILWIQMLWMLVDIPGVVRLFLVWTSFCHDQPTLYIYSTQRFKKHWNHHELFELISRWNKNWQIRRSSVFRSLFVSSRTQSDKQLNPHDGTMINAKLIPVPVIVQSMRGTRPTIWPIRHVKIMIATTLCWLLEYMHDSWNRRSWNLLPVKCSFYLWR